MTAHDAGLVASATLLAVLAVFWLITGLIELFVRWREKRRGPYDWSKELPELRDTEHHHVRVVHVPPRWQ